MHSRLGAWVYNREGRAIETYICCRRVALWTLTTAIHCYVEPPLFTFRYNWLLEDASPSLKGLFRYEDEAADLKLSEVLIKGGQLVGLFLGLPIFCTVPGGS
jgi:hypothetical protein